MMKIDLSKLLGGQEFNVHSQIAYNGLSFSMIILADTKANDFLFIDTQWAIKIVKYFEISIIQLRTAAGTKGFNKQPEILITHAIMLTWSLMDGDS